jgi:hypothetical protein
MNIVTVCVCVCVGSSACDSQLRHCSARRTSIHEETDAEHERCTKQCHSDHDIKHDATIALSTVGTRRANVSCDFLASHVKEQSGARESGVRWGRHKLEE